MVTDHAPLTWMAGAKDSNARVTRWFLALQDFSFRVDHRPGREHANADALSRRDNCLGGFPGDQRPEQAVEECGIPPHEPRPGRVRGEVVDGIYRRHPPTGDREHHFSLPNQRDWGTPAGWYRSHVKRAMRTGRRDREPWRARKPTR